MLLAVELCRHLESFNLKVKGISDRRMLAGQAVQGAVALTDSGIRRRGDANRRQLQAQEYAGKLQEILARAAVSEPEEQEEVVGEAEALADLELGAEEGRALLAAHPGANSRSAFAQVEEPARVMALINRSSLLDDWPSAEIKEKAGALTSTVATPLFECLL